MTFEEAKQRALASSKLLNMAGLNAQEKAFAVRAMQADYFPKVSGSSCKPAGASLGLLKSCFSTS